MRGPDLDSGYSVQKAGHEIPWAAYGFHPTDGEAMRFYCRLFYAMSLEQREDKSCSLRLKSGGPVKIEARL